MVFKTKHSFTLQMLPVAVMLGQISFGMMTSWNGDIFRTTGHLWGNSLVTSEFHAQRPVMRSFDIFFDLRLNKRLSQQSGGWWFEMPSHPLWRYCNGYFMTWWHHGMERLSILLTICEGNPLGNSGFPSQRASNGDIWCFSDVSLNNTVEQTLERLVIWNAMMPMWCHRNESFLLIIACYII